MLSYSHSLFLPSFPRSSCHSTFCRSILAYSGHFIQMNHITYSFCICLCLLCKMSLMSIHDVICSGISFLLKIKFYFIDHLIHTHDTGYGVCVRSVIAFHFHTASLCCSPLYTRLAGPRASVCPPVPACSLPAAALGLTDDPITESVFYIRV